MGQKEHTKAPWRNLTVITCLAHEQGGMVAGKGRKLEKRAYAHMARPPIFHGVCMKDA
jgi:hypothetical protein